MGKLIDKRPAHQLEDDSIAMLAAFASGAAPPAIFAGRVTDDTVLTLALAEVITATGGVSRDAFERDLRVINPHGGRQVYKLKAASDSLYVAPDGATNGCVPRSATIGYVHWPDELGDLCYDTLKTVTLTHAHADAVMAALVFTVTITHAIAGDSPQATAQALRRVLTGLTRIAGGGSEVGKAVIEHTGAARRFDRASKYVDYLEDAVGMAAAARSSAVAGICLGLSGLFPQEVLPTLLCRRRAACDLDSVAAIYGALVGAFRPDSIPATWVTRVERYAGRSFMQIAQELHAVRVQRRAR